MNLRVWAILWIALAVGGCDVIRDRLLLTEAPPAAIDTALVARGATVYYTNYCGTCHALDLIGSNGYFGPAHNQAGEDALVRLADAGYRGSATTAAEYLYEAIVQPDVYITSGYEITAHRMPAYSHLPEADLQALVAMLAAQPLPPTVTIDWQPPG